METVTFYSPNGNCVGTVTFYFKRETSFSLASDWLENNIQFPCGMFLSPLTLAAAIYTDENKFKTDG